MDKIQSKCSTEAKTEDFPSIVEALGFQFLRCWKCMETAIKLTINVLSPCTRNALFFLHTACRYYVR